MNLSTELTKLVTDHLNEVRKYLGALPADERQEILQSIESHIYDALQSRSDGDPSPALLDAVIAEMDPPDSYGELPAAPQKKEPRRKLIITLCGLALVTLAIAGIRWWPIKSVVPIDHQVNTDIVPEQEIIPAPAEETGRDLFKHKEGRSEITITGGERSLSGDVVIPSKINEKPVTKIEGKAFYYNQEVSKVTLPASVTNVGLFNFSSCEKLTSIDVAEDNPSLTSNDEILFSKDLKLLIQAPSQLSGNYRIPKGVVGLGRSAFRGCKISSLHIPAGVMNAGTYTFSDLPNLKAITVDDANPQFSSIDGVLFNKPKTRLIKFPQTRGGDYAIPEGVEELANGAFANNQKIQSIALPNTLKFIRRDVFLKCRNLTNIELPDSLEVIEPLSFSLSGIQKVNLPKNVKEIGSIAFRHCEGLVRLTVDKENPYFCSMDNVLYSKDMKTLVLCLNSKKGVLKVPDTVTTLGPWPFDSCNELTEIHLPESLTNLGNGAFIRAGGLTSITIPPKIKFLDYYSFLGCRNLQWILFLGDAPGLGRNVFKGCPGAIKIFYKKSANGFASPKWNGFESKGLTDRELKDLLEVSKNVSTNPVTPVNLSKTKKLMINHKKTF